MVIQPYLFPKSVFFLHPLLSCCGFWLGGMPTVATKFIPIPALERNTEEIKSKTRQFMQEK